MRELLVNLKQTEYTDSRIHVQKFGYFIYVYEKREVPKDGRPVVFFEKDHLAAILNT